MFRHAEEKKIEPKNESSTSVDLVTKALQDLIVNQTESLEKNLADLSKEETIRLLKNLFEKKEINGADDLEKTIKIEIPGESQEKQKLVRYSILAIACDLLFEKESFYNNKNHYFLKHVEYTWQITQTYHSMYENLKKENSTESKKKNLAITASLYTTYSSLFLYLKKKEKEKPSFNHSKKDVILGSTFNSIKLFLSELQDFIQDTLNMAPFNKNQLDYLDTFLPLFKQAEKEAREFSTAFGYGIHSTMELPEKKQSLNESIEKLIDFCSLFYKERKAPEAIPTLEDNPTTLFQKPSTPKKILLTITTNSDGSGYNKFPKPRTSNKSNPY